MSKFPSFHSHNEYESACQIHAELITRKNLRNLLEDDSKLLEELTERKRMWEMGIVGMAPELGNTDGLIECGVVMLPTRRPEHSVGDLLQNTYTGALSIAAENSNGGLDKMPSHIYFTSKNEIKFHCHVLNIITGEVYKYTHARHLIIGDSISNYLKIEATTDSSLNLPGITKEWIEKAFIPANGSIKTVTLQTIQAHSNEACAKEANEDLWQVAITKKGNKVIIHSVPVRWKHKDIVLRNPAQELIDSPNGGIVYIDKSGEERLFTKKEMQNIASSAFIAGQAGYNFNTNNYIDKIAK